MKLLIYQPRASYYVGGGEVVAINQAIHLIKKGFDVCFATSRASWLKESEIFKNFKNTFPENILQVDIPDRIRLIYDIKPGADWFRWDLESLHFGLYVKETINNVKYDVGICHLPLDLVALDSLKRNIVYLHGYPSTINYACELVLYNQKKYIAVSGKVKEEWQKLIDDKDVEVVYNGIDTSYFSPDEKENKIYDALFVGRLLESKGILNLLAAFKKLLQQHGNLKLAIVGTGPLEEAIRVYIRENKLESNIIVFGYVAEKILLSLYRKSKLAVLPSLNKEGVLTTALEASACGLPVITSKGSSLQEYIKPGRNGILVDPSIDSEIADAIEQLLADESLFKEMSKNARLMSLDWDWDNKIEELKEIILKYE